MKKNTRYFIILFFLAGTSCSDQNTSSNDTGLNDNAGIKDKPFTQEYHQAYRLGSTVERNDVRTIVVDQSGQVWAGTKVGLFVLDQDKEEWKGMIDSTNQGPVNDLFVDSKGIVWIAAWNGLYRAENNRTDKIVREPRERKVEDHWLLSKDGKWLWKRGTSSDEITGHMYGYLFYYDLVAKEEERKHVKEHILCIVNYIIDNGYVLIDIDGMHTEWGVWAPEYLNNDPDWASEKGVNSVEILSYLKLAYHVSGNEHYQNEYYKLLNKHHYKSNIVHAKTTLPSWRTYIDDELLALAYPALLLYEDDPELQDLYRTSLDNWYDALKNDDNPYFYFIYNALAANKLNFEKSIQLLQDNPLDLIRWRIDNSKREDLSLTRYPILEDIQTSRLVPPSERGIMRWDKNPWKAIQGDGGYTESDGVYWLLAYWMGRYHGFIE